MLRNSDWDALHLGYFLGYACWNYFVTPFLFTYRGVVAREIEPWHEAGQSWRRLAVQFPPQVVTHNPEQVFYFDSQGLQRRMDYIVEINGGTLVATTPAATRTSAGWRWLRAAGCTAAIPTTP